MSELKIVCQHLDLIIVDYFNTQDEYFTKQEILEKEMREGLFLMAKARYSMGAKSVGSTQYHLEQMEASNKVDLTPADPVLEQDDPYMTFDLSKEITAGEMSADPEKGDGDGLRRRNVTEKEKRDTDEDKLSEIVERVQELSIAEKSSPAKTSHKDPIRWFGVLVPHALKESQRSFRSVVGLGCEVASLKAKLVNLQATIRKLLRRKEDIISSIDDSGFVIYDESSFLSSSSSSASEKAGNESHLAS